MFCVRNNNPIGFRHPRENFLHRQRVSATVQGVLRLRDSVRFASGIAALRMTMMMEDDDG